MDDEFHWPGVNELNREMNNCKELRKEIGAFEHKAVDAFPEMRHCEDDLPFEFVEDCNTDLIGFEELANMMNIKVKYFFSFSAKYNYRTS